MSDSKTFHGVTQAIFDCVKTTSAQQHGTVYNPANGNSGTSKTTGTGWEVDMTFNFDPSSGDLAYTITYKTWIVPVSSVWDGISDTINLCRKQCG
ncbi:MAG: hypothetical protein PHO08_07570 [Methylococcales bacterium]|nr:hypothetical protein [Methylococcales bacterium]MDD5632876.1 hypothetical protein [Methylococcales bacterium]